jgi:hypothetical protein
LLRPPAGNILQFRFFLRNDAGILVALFWLFAWALSSFAYFVSVFLAKQQSAVYTGFVIFLVSTGSAASCMVVKAAHQWCDG